jgi:hypothetical protein
MYVVDGQWVTYGIVKIKEEGYKVFGVGVYNG